MKSKFPINLKGLEKHLVIALIYLAFFVVSGVIAFIFFSYLSSTAAIEGSWQGLTVKFGGAIAGFLATFFLLHWTYEKILSPKKLSITGNVFDENGGYVKGATVAVDGVDRRKTTDENGWFNIEVDDKPEWTVRAHKADALGHVTLSNREIQQVVRLVLKKKVH